MHGVLTPSFRNRLRLFFTIIVIIPMVAVAAVLFRLVGASDESKADARLAEAQRAATGLYQERQAEAEGAARTIARGAGLSGAINDDDQPRIQSLLSELAAANGADRAVLRIGDNEFEAGRPPAVAPARIQLDDQERTVGSIAVSTTSAGEYAQLLERVTGMFAVVLQGDRVLAATLPDPPRGDLPDRGDAEIGGVDYRLTTFTAPGFDGEELTVRLLGPESDDGGLLSATSLVVLLVLVGFLVLAFAFALTVSRTLQSEIARLLEAAQRLGRGDFRVAVPAEGNDEFAALGKEFNNMARQLESRLEELQLERARLAEAIRRVGESFAKGLDRVGLLEIVVQTAVDGIGAACGRATMRRGPEDRLREVARTGDPQAFSRALHAAEAAVIDAGQIAEIQVGGASALAAPLGAGESERVIGIISIARGDRPFSAGERELFAYLTNQAAVSVENVDLHETVQRQAVTDELTGLFNHRRFQEVMAVEVARVLRQSSREIDEPARYGGEEMAVALPGTDLQGAYQFAERVRHRIQALDLPLPDGDGTLRVTASFGAASLATAAGKDKDALVAAADAALYEAKRSGKNRTVRAEAPEGSPHVPSGT
jgi:GGDEF domain-containing protein/HAMP domain-containing protein